MHVLVGHQVAAVRLPFARVEADRHPGRDPQRPQQHRHRGGELLAVAAFAREQEVCQRPGLGGGCAVQVVGEGTALQVVLDGDSLLVGAGRGSRELPCQVVDPGVGAGGQFGVDLQLGWDGCQRGRELFAGGGWDGCFDLVGRVGGGGPGAEHRAGLGGQPPVTVKTGDSGRGAGQREVVRLQVLRHADGRGDLRAVGGGCRPGQAVADFCLASGAQRPQGELLPVELFERGQPQILR